MKQKEKEAQENLCYKEELFWFIISTIDISTYNTCTRKQSYDVDDDDDIGLMFVLITTSLVYMFLPKPKFPLMFTNLHK
jgi:hypothetical protein